MCANRANGGAPCQFNSAFDAAWDALADQGSCDARGAEYERVLGEWEGEGLMVALLRFILISANRPAPSPLPDNSRSESESTPPHQN